MDAGAEVSNPSIRKGWLQFDQDVVDDGMHSSAGRAATAADESSPLIRATVSVSRRFGGDAERDRDEQGTPVA